METMISGSVRLPSTTSKHLKVCLNFRKEHVEHLGLDANRHLEITRSGEALYKIRFFAKATARSRPLQFNTTSGGARVYVEPSVFKLDKLDEPLDASPISAQYFENGLTFEFDKEEFLKPKQKIIAKIVSKADKVENGFEPNSAFGEKFQHEMDKAIKNRIDAYMRAKYGAIDGFDI